MILKVCWKTSLVGWVGTLAVMGQATSLEVANPSFESPVWTGPLPVDIRLDGWTKTPPSPFFVPQGALQTWAQTSGVFPNPPVGEPGRIPNADGNQAAYLMAIPFAGFSQELPAKFEAGLTYELTVGVRGGGNMANGTSLMVTFFYVNALSEQVNMGFRFFDYRRGPADAWPALTDISVTTAVVPVSEAALGRNIHIGLISINGNGEGYWDLDNVRVTASVVPEPGTGGLMALGGLVGGVLLWARRRR